MTVQQMRQTVAQRRNRTSKSISVPRALLLGACLYLGGLSTGSLLCEITSIHSSGSFVGGRVRPVGTPRSGSDIAMEEASPIRSPDSSTVTTTRLNAAITLLHPNDLKVPVPIIVMGLMKAGTTSIYSYFQCGLDPASSKLSHYDCKPDARDPQKIKMSCGKRMRRNWSHLHKPIFDEIDDFTVYTEIDAQENNGGMTLPQWDYMEGIATQFPHATWILNIREPTRWLESIDRWKDLRQRFIDNSFVPDLPRGQGGDDADMIHFYQTQAQRVRDFVARRPTLTLVEVSIDSWSAGQVMEESFGISKACWRNRNVNNGTAIWKMQ